MAGRQQLHNRQNVYRWIVDYKVRNNGNSPSIREICNHFKIGSTSTAVNILFGLQREGLIRLGTLDKARSITVIGGKFIAPMG